MRIIDLSAPIAPSRPDAAPFERVELRYTSHAEGAAQIEGMLGVPPRLLRDGEGWAIEEFTRLGTHSGSPHVDRTLALQQHDPGPAGRHAIDFDELPLEWFFGEGVVLDMTAKADGEKVQVEDVEGRPWRRSTIRSGRWTSCCCGPAVTPSTVRPITCGGAVPSRPRRPDGCTSGASG